MDIKVFTKLTENTHTQKDKYDGDEVICTYIRDRLGMIEDTLQRNQIL